MTRRGRQPATGFTLLELLVALTIFTSVSVIGYTGLRSALEARLITERHSDRLASLQRAFMRIELDLTQLANRSARDAQGDSQPPFRTAGSAAKPILELTSGGRTNPAALPRSGFERIEYRLEDQRVIRLSWPKLDRIPGSRARERTLLEDVDALSWRFIDIAGRWHAEWPPSRRTVAASGALPAGVEIVVSTPNGKIRRLFATGWQEP